MNLWGFHNLDLRRLDQLAIFMPPLGLVDQPRLEPAAPPGIPGTAGKVGSRSPRAARPRPPEVEVIGSNISAALRDSPSTVVEADNLCHQAIFMNHASGAVASPNVEVAYVDDIIWQRAKRTRPG